jgi:hypothetical protein
MKYNPGAAARNHVTELIVESVGPGYPSMQLFIDAKLEWHLLLKQLVGLENEHLLVINKRATYTIVVTKTLQPKKCF